MFSNENMIGKFNLLTDELFYSNHWDLDWIPYIQKFMRKCISKVLNPQRNTTSSYENWATNMLDS